MDRYERLHLSTELTKQDVEHICTVHKCSTDGCACRDFRSESDCIMSFALGIREGTIHPRVMETPEEPHTGSLAGKEVQLHVGSRAGLWHFALDAEGTGRPFLVVTTSNTQIATVAGVGVMYCKSNLQQLVTRA